MNAVIELFRPVGAAELALIRESGWRAFPSRLQGQPIFYPVVDEEYARQIARDWNSRRTGVGFVVRFTIESEYLKSYEVHQVGARIHREYWIPAAELDNFNNNIVGQIEVVASFESGDEVRRGPEAEGYRRPPVRIRSRAKARVAQR